MAKSEEHYTESAVTLKIQYRNESIDVPVDQDETISSLAMRCAEKISADLERISLFILPSPGMLKHPFSDRKIHDILTPKTRIKLVGTPNEEVKKINKMSVVSRSNPRPSTFTPVTAYKSRDWKRTQEEITYTFHAIEPLPYLSNPEKSRRFLERLANDPGIKTAMRKHKFSVGMLTEMNPAEHTTHESRTLGLNRNRGEVIELRLRTDRYDGYRDYKTIRTTLCHELAHNVWGDHDRNFYNLMQQIEKEVEQADWKHGGNRLTQEEFYNPNDSLDDVEHADGGGWTGGDFVLGRSENTQSQEGLSRSEILARAALSRIKKQREADQSQSPPDADQ